ncbi:hypothetical protein [Bradyrhizobium sp. JR18.2]|uniref:hypothetical protein n=1 Tax=Bradyrhizobium sp. JR18.2 TaxID=3156369 RepID=UPI00339402E1
MTNEHPFIPGAKVAMQSGGRWGAAEWQEFEVEKLFKNGRFTLKGREGQWNAYPPSANGYGDKHWHAYRAGSSRYGEGTLLIWDENSDAEIKEGFATSAREKRLKKLQHGFERLRYGDVTDAALDAIESALSLSRPERS